MSTGAGMAMDGPFELTMKVHLIGEGKMMGNNAKADVSMPLGSLPTADDFVRLISYTLAQVGPDFRLPSRHEFLQNELAERSGAAIKFAVPGPDKFSLASAIEARSDATGTGAAEGESATRQGDAQ